MFRRLVIFSMTHPLEGVSALRILRAYRQAQETLRVSCPDVLDIAAAQEQLAARQTGVAPTRVRECVARWMEQEPLALVASARRDGLLEALGAGRRRGLRLGVYSDYPAHAKLDAMQIGSFFDVVVSAQDADVRRFKPDPRGLLVTAERLGVTPDQALYVGDRPDVDTVAAQRAGMACVIVQSGSVTRPVDLSLSLPVTCRALAEALDRKIL
jgi:phosphoglycolate phosphatase/putative hydrolase of the HAD superfamily